MTDWLYAGHKSGPCPLLSVTSGKRIVSNSGVPLIISKKRGMHLKVLTSDMEHVDHRGQDYDSIHVFIIAVVS